VSSFLTGLDFRSDTSKHTRNYLHLKGYDADNGFVWYSKYDHYGSKHLEPNTQASLCFIWYGPVIRKVIIYGSLEKVDKEQIEQQWYYQTR
jgi:pyridoxine/pyridoxamine 5'-phosphate oxidase